MPWLSLIEAAEVYQRCPRTLRRYIHDGKLTSKLTNGSAWSGWPNRSPRFLLTSKGIPKERYGMRMFDLYEGLFTLRMRFEGPLEMAEFLENASPPSSQEKALAFHKNCRFFFDHLDTCFRLVDKLLNNLELDQLALLTLYRTLVILKTHWQESGLYLREEQMEKNMKWQRDTLTILSHLLEQVRVLLLLCAQQFTTETESRAVLIKKAMTGEERVTRLVNQNVKDRQPQIDESVSLRCASSQAQSDLQKDNQRRG